MKVTNLRPALCMMIMTAVYSAVVPIQSAERPASNVPPGWEIEVIDPNADPLGRPATELHEEDGSIRVDIPAAILVHKYYYTGDRSFQAQSLPGGPVILVLHHPKTSEQLYLEAQLLPGAPRVTYTAKSVEYDYGEHAITVHFGLFGRPSVKYRSGTPLNRKLGKLVHAEQLKGFATKTREKVAESSGDAMTMAYGGASSVTESAKTALLPVQNILQSLPLGKMIFSPDAKDQLLVQAAQHKLDRARKLAEKKRKRDELTLPTIR